MSDPDNNVSRFGSGPVDAHFYHASGFPVGVYTPLLERLSEKLNISALHLRPTWDNPGPLPRNRSWNLYADDLIRFIERTYDQPIIGMGHSLGSSSTVLAAVRRPDLFKALVLIESTQLPKLTSKMASLIPKPFYKYLEPAKSSMAKPFRWDSRQSFLRDYRAHRAYKRISDENLAYFAQYAVRESKDGGVELAYRLDWETLSYMAPPFILDTLCELKTPTVAIRARPSIFLSEESWQKWKASSPTNIFKENLNYGHLFPLEAPDSCADLVLEGLEELRLI